MKISKNEVEEANVKFFSVNASNYNNEEPNYLPENKRRVKKILKNIAIHNPGKFLDVGCGTGFLLDLAYPYFDKLFGVDITQAMLDQVNLRKGKIEILKNNSEKLPFEDNQFDVCASYGFLHHLYRLEPTLKEIFRCMKKGAVFYSDQDPNYYFWKHLSNLDINKIDNKFVRNEVLSVQDPEEGFRWKYMKGYKKTGKKIVSISEYQKVIKGGIKDEIIKKTMLDIGFKDIKINYEWYLGEGHVIHKISRDADRKILSYLQSCLPISRELFKYISITAKK
jgi:ubiquinone/menaquinone biosynthesis C-methylase UbiE